MTKPFSVICTKRWEVLGTVWANSHDQATKIATNKFYWTDIKIVQDVDNATLDQKKLT